MGGFWGNTTILPIMDISLRESTLKATADALLNDRLDNILVRVKLCGHSILDTIRTLVLPI